MRVPTLETGTASPTEAAADLLILPVFQGRTPGPGVETVRAALGTDLMAAVRDQGFEGRLGQTVTVPSFGRIRAGTIMLVGLGPEAEAGPGQLRRAAQKAGRHAGRYPRAATTLGQVGPDAEESAHALAEGLLLGSYRFDRYKERPIDTGS